MAGGARGCPVQLGLGWTVSPLPPGPRRSAVPRCRRWWCGMLCPAPSAFRCALPAARRAVVLQERLRSCSSTYHCPGTQALYRSVVLCGAPGARGGGGRSAQSGVPGRPLGAQRCSAPSGAMDECVSERWVLWLRLCMFVSIGAVCARPGGS